MLRPPSCARALPSELLPLLGLALRARARTCVHELDTYTTCELDSPPFAPHHTFDDRPTLND